MDEQELRELEDPSTWEDEADSIRPPVKSSRAVVSVAFARADFERVVAAAREQGLKTSEFIRRAALGDVERLGPRATVFSISGNVQTEYSITRLRAAKAEATLDSPRQVFSSV
jgi:hypothetical protein